VVQRLFALTVLTALLAASARAAPSAPPRGLITYWTESPIPSIWAVRPDGTHKTKIFRNLQQNSKRPTLSPDRTWVAFDGTPPGKPAMSDFDIQLIRLNGTARRTLVDAPQWDTDAQWSPDGDRITFTRSPPSPMDCSDAQIWVVDRDGGDLHEVTAGCGARWSPDGTRLAYTTQGTNGFTISTVGLDGANAKPLLSLRDALQVAGWSRGRILFTRGYDSSGRNGAVFVMNDDGTRVRKLVRGFASSWSPEGTKILYSPIALFGPVLVMDADGSHKGRIPGVVGADAAWR
jgi:Tol biopolymer transport system component